jgi:hypothetical protein
MQLLPFRCKLRAKLAEQLFRIVVKIGKLLSSTSQTHYPEQKKRQKMKTKAHTETMDQSHTSEAISTKQTQLDSYLC